MTDLYFKIASAIATIEGFFVDGSLPSRNNNPGDLRSAPWLVHPVITNGFWTAVNAAEGTAGLYHQIALDAARGLTLQQLISQWAPPTDGNRTAQYIADVARLVGIDPEQPVWNYLEVQKLAA